MLYGMGKYIYELVEGWMKLPKGWPLDMNLSGLAVDSQDRVYVFSRSNHPVAIFDRQGNLLTSWGEGYFKRAHGIYVGSDGSIYCTDDSNHTVSKFTFEGKLLQVLGNKDQPSDTGYVQKSKLSESLATIKRGGPPFNRPTGVAQSSSGEIYVTDGYGNARVHKFSANGALLFSWGEPGYAPGQFTCPHSVCVDKQERVWIADRENGRIQTFNAQGEFLSQWANLSRPSDVCVDDEGTVYVIEAIPGLRLGIFSTDGKLLSYWGAHPKEDPKTAVLLGPHAMAVDSHGDIYIGQASNIDRYPERAGMGSKCVLKFARRT
jgi:DNA-binding beta-propeller fold protein YncE